MLNRVIFVLAVFGMCVTANAQWTTVWQAGNIGAGWPQGGTGGGPNVNFVQEAGVNPPPGVPNNPPVNQQADDDYYFAGVYPAAPTGVGTVAANEEAFERAFAGVDNDLRIHFNLPAGLNPSDQFRFSWEANNLDQRAENPDPRYGVEVSVNGTLVQGEQLITPAELNTVYTTPIFTASDVGLVGGEGADNIVALRGINYNGDGGGNWMGLDYHHLETVPEPGALGMLLSGLFWAFPWMWSEARKAKAFRQRKGC